MSNNNNIMMVKVHREEGFGYLVAAASNSPTRLPGKRSGVLISGRHPPFFFFSLHTYLVGETPIKKGVFYDSLLCIAHRGGGSH